MRVTVVALSILFVVCPALGSVAGAMDLEEGFMGRLWASEISDQEGMTRLYATKAVAYYISPDEVYAIGDVPVPGVIYGFYYGKLFAVYIEVDTLEAYSDLRQYLQSNYGLPDKGAYMKSGLTVDKWKHKDIKIKLKSNEGTGKKKLAFYYTPLSEKLNEQELEAFERIRVEKSRRLFPIDKDERPAMIPLLRF